MHVPVQASGASTASCHSCWQPARCCACPNSWTATPLRPSSPPGRDSTVGPCRHHLQPARNFPCQHGAHDPSAHAMTHSLCGWFACRQGSDDNSVGAELSKLRNAGPLGSDRHRAHQFPCQCGRPDRAGRRGSPLSTSACPLCADQLPPSRAAQGLVPPCCAAHAGHFKHKTGSYTMS